MAYKRKHLLPYQESLERLLDETTFRSELSLFSIGSESCVVKEVDRHTIMSVLLRILYGKPYDTSCGTSRGTSRGMSVVRRTVCRATHVISRAVRHTECRMVCCTVRRTVCCTVYRWFYWAGKVLSVSPLRSMITFLVDQKGLSDIQFTLAVFALLLGFASCPTDIKYSIYSRNYLCGVVPSQIDLLLDETGQVYHELDHWCWCSRSWNANSSITY